MFRELKSFFLAGAVAAGFYVLYKLFRRRRSILDSEEPATVSSDLEISDCDNDNISSSQCFENDEFFELHEDESGSSSVNEEIENSSFVPAAQLDDNFQLINPFNHEYIEFLDTIETSTEISEDIMCLDIPRNPPPSEEDDADYGPCCSCQTFTENSEDNMSLDIPRNPPPSLEDLGEYRSCCSCQPSLMFDCQKKRLVDSIQNLVDERKPKKKKRFKKFRRFFKSVNCFRANKEEE